MSGLRRLCKAYGRVKINGALWLWDYCRDEPRLKSEMTPEEIKSSEEARGRELYEAYKSIQKENNGTGKANP